MRKARIKRCTKETDIDLAFNLDGGGAELIDTGCGFLNHMLTLFAAHGSFGLKVVCKGDTDVDYHHTTEDIGIALGEAFNKAIGDKKGIVRYGHIILPMDEALVLAAVDISGRDTLVFDMDIPTEKVGDFDTELVMEFFMAFVRKAEITLHIKQLDGLNSHHIIEAAFKGTARALKMAAAIDQTHADEIPSTKGLLS